MCLIRCHSYYNDKKRVFSLWAHKPHPPSAFNGQANQKQTKKVDLNRWRRVKTACLKQFVSWGAAQSPSKTNKIIYNSNRIVTINKTD